ncbi:MAG: FAD-binding oxidoreductase [Candidatus Paceibacterota bacterium]|jgi:ring-1,2-phenylacetyl-CoA epoxidase subunit PaaE
MKIMSMKATVTGVDQISPTAREIHLSLPEDIGFIPGSFINVFADVEGKRVRRAYSISSSNRNQREVSLSVRIIPNGTISPLFVEKNILGRQFDIMGPLGINTADKMSSKRIFLIGFGIGVSPIKSLAHFFSESTDVYELSILTGSRSREEVLYDDLFEKLATSKNGVYKAVISDEADTSWPLRGFIQNHIDDLDFNNCAVYVCGQGQACRAIESAILKMNPVNCKMLIEDFH